ncbi:MAG: ATP-binding cassette domain-containing protein [Lachnospiraceae bacterium]|nr:ATP-binding cassette domain-containing protein [Lachnospiraceae bacterium]
MEIHKGDIYGFVGKNGAGKTTLIRLLAGLVQQTDGTVELFSESVSDKLYLQRYRINGFIEKPALNSALTAQDNLKICCLQRGLEYTNCINEVLEESGLSQFDIKNVKVRNFSLGMKQRLGIAMALLGKPELLFLDEPLNGLDPEGIRDFRKLIKKLHQEYGTTILISSHQLRELTQVATCYGFIHKGKMLEQISAEDLKRKIDSEDLEEYFISLINKKQ